MPELALYAIGRDRPGIVAAVAKVLLDHGVNIEDSQATILRGHFALVQILRAPEGTDVAALRQDLEGVARGLSLEWVHVDEVEEAEEAPEPTHIVTVYGGDHPGIVHAVTAALAERAIGITDLNSRVVADEPQEDLYVLMLEVQLPGGAPGDDLRAALDEVGQSEGVEVTMRELEQDEL